jgi:dihydroorotate dehydrogenase electron transfer subunit
MSFAPADCNPPPILPGMVCTAVQTVGEVVDQVELAHETFCLRIACPQLARQIVPGQFFMLRPLAGTDPLLGRPFALYDVYLGPDGQPAGIDFGYHVVGKVTGMMSQWCTGQTVELWGPLGNGFPLPSAGHLVCVGGGIGYTPFLAVAREAVGQRRYGRPPRAIDHPAARVTMLYGVRSRRMRADLAEFADIPNFETRIATDDGSEGHHGFVTELLERSLSQAHDRPAAVYVCGPVPMMRAAAALCERRDVPCWLSLESPMACGFGACFSCVTRVRVPHEPGWDYRRTCVEGPVFRSTALALES